MTFTQIQTEILDRLNLTSTEASTRIGRLINSIYRSVTSSIGLQLSRQASFSETVTIASSFVTFSSCEKVERVWTQDADDHKTFLREVHLMELRDIDVTSSDAPRRYAIYSNTADTIVIILDAAPETGYTLYADGMSSVTDLAGSNEPAFPESFHDILVEGVLAYEYRKLEKIQYARDAEALYQKRLSDLRMWIAKSYYLDTRQNFSNSLGSIARAGGGGGAAATAPWATITTVSALWTFDLGAGITPFAVAQADAPYVVNLGAEFLGNIATDRLIGRDTAGTGETEQITVSGGLEWTGSGGIQRSALTGDVTASAASNATTIANNAVTTVKIIDDAVTTAKIIDDAVTYAKMQNISATDRLLGRDTAAAGNVEELTVGGGLEFSGSGGIQRSALTGDVTASAAGSATTIADAVWLSMNSLQGGRLTLSSGTPVTSSDITGASSIAYTPYTGASIALYSGTAWRLYTFTERTLSLTLTSGKNYDVFIYNNSGTLTLELSAAWTTDTARADALTTQDGVIVKSGATTRRWLGTIRASGTNTTEDSAAKRFVWNAYNQVPRQVYVTDTTNSWTYTTATIRQANGSAGNKVEVVTGRAGHLIDVVVEAFVSNSGADVAVGVFVGEDTTSDVTTGHVGGIVYTSIAGRAQVVRDVLRKQVALGYHYYAWLEYSQASGTTTWLGDDGATLRQSGITTVWAC